jgi:tRNA 2-selenouridine synthase
MSYKQITVTELISTSNIQIVDVRSPAEFKAGHIPNAINMPLFSDEERAQVGTTYKQKSKQEAILLGLEIVGPRMKQMVEHASGIAKDNKLIVHCWRGGQRSNSVAWLLHNAGLEVAVLNKGYKAYRNYIHDFFEQTAFRFLILGGRTGSAKTSVLREMIKMGEQVLDLEALAHHKGSAFGWIGEQAQETNEQFENNLFHALNDLNAENSIWIENESKTIGRNYIPENLWKKLKSSPLINIELEMNERLNHLVACYDLNDKVALINSFEKIVKRLGHENAKAAMDLVNENKFAEAAQIALTYYDKCYDYNLKENKSPEIHTLHFDRMNIPEIAKELIHFKHEHFGK